MERELRANRKRTTSAVEDVTELRKRHRGQPKPKNAPVPAPTIKDFSPVIGGNRGEDRSATSQKRLAFQAIGYKANQWIENTPVFSVSGIKLAALTNRPKNSKFTKDPSNLVIEEMQNLEADACSGIWEDEDGNRLLCVFSSRIRALPQALPEAELPQETSAEQVVRRLYPGPKGRTLADVEQSKANNIGVYYDGIPNDLLIQYHQSAQLLHSFLPPVAAERDIRHPTDKVMQYKREGVGEENDKISFEQTGVLHLVHAWHAQGHPNGLLYPSSDISRTGQGTMAVNHYFNSTRALALHLAECFKVAFPDIYTKYQKAFDAGVWNESDPGPWIGRAIVWKLPVLIHQDGLDDGPTAAFNVGSYKGGEMYLPDIRVKLAYRPGDLLIFLSGQLYHRVGDWEPLLMKKNQAHGLTPGRIGNVFFFPKTSYDVLKNKSPGWNKATMTGKTADYRM
ncbi:hypothetical protein GALMADRAFT_148389 [Galerina marginata CBS 339.88]|uniref:Uncharacterized protein n=1 Tax=Galerina marginata (strain CBS 339.88) TaxID=685588 RepID=A0A067S4R6_GALM3|nr:hypothetical protein GALMADRAFT_148389 [Galerina marginata CBS 339.88]